MLCTQCSKYTRVGASIRTQFQDGRYGEPASLRCCVTCVVLFSDLARQRSGRTCHVTLPLTVVTKACVAGVTAPWLCRGHVIWVGIRGGLSAGRVSGACALQTDRGWRRTREDRAELGAEAAGPETQAEPEEQGRCEGRITEVSGEELSAWAHLPVLHSLTLGEGSRAPPQPAAEPWPSGRTAVGAWPLAS
ncbi:hypothetical protein NDU88_000585 [Pleurodeles waltl]|uniref:Uncharacterized protein n=1 Tax=Pleurodeles waltl TaxID=8319 RepID=A0AAV7L8K2_PLEWA|nr:hypothetical protein NDU88_000585 [Pleurodeles waltl]